MVTAVPMSSRPSLTLKPRLCFPLLPSTRAVTQQSFLHSADGTHRVSISEAAVNKKGSPLSSQHLQFSGSDIVQTFTQAMTRQLAALERCHRAHCGPLPVQGNQFPEQAAS